MSAGSRGAVPKPRPHGEGPSPGLKWAPTELGRGVTEPGAPLQGLGGSSRIILPEVFVPPPPRLCALLVN